MGRTTPGPGTKVEPFFFSDVIETVRMIYTLDQARMTQLTCPKSALLWLEILTKIMLVVGVSDGNHQTSSDVAKKVSTTLITGRASATRTELKTSILLTTV